MGSLVSDLLYIRRSRTLLIAFAAFTVGINAFVMISDLAVYDKEPDTWYFVWPYVFTCEIDEFPKIDGRDSNQRNPLKWWLNCASFQLTDNYKFIPGLFGIAIMPLVYLLGSYITNDRFIGLVSLISFTVNPLYTDWATQGTYDQVWAFFFVLSLVFLFRRKTPASIISIVLSISAKAMAGLMLPVYLYTMYQQPDKKKYVWLTIGLIGVASLIGVFVLEIGFVGADVGFYPERWDEAVFRNISLFWQIIPILALFVVLNRNFIPIQKMPNLKIVSLWMLAFFMINPFVYFFTMQDTYSYRYVPLAAFMSVFIGMTLVNMGNWWHERQLGLHKKVHA